MFLLFMSSHVSHPSVEEVIVYSFIHQIRNCTFGSSPASVLADVTSLECALASIVVRLPVWVEVPV